MLPNRVNEMWIDPQETGLYLGQCAQFCGMEHAKMLLRVYVDSPEQFQQWIAESAEDAERTRGNERASFTMPNQGNGGKTSSAAEFTVDAHGARRAAAGAPQEINAHDGQVVFEQQACINCHTVAGTVANGRYGPDLTHLMSRDTLASGAMPNTAGESESLDRRSRTHSSRAALMPAMHLTDRQNAQITAYLLTLK